MAYVLSRNMSYSALRSYVVGVIATLEAAGLADFAALWRTERDAIIAALAAQAADEDHEAVTTARVRFCDAAWDQAIGALSKRALYLAGNDSKAAPYVQLFGKVKTKELQRLGAARAGEAAAKLLAQLESIGHPELSGRDLAAKTEALTLAEKADAEAELKLATHGIERAKTIQKIEKLIAETEAKILTRHPGRDDLVRVILSPNPSRSRAPSVQPVDSPS